MKGSLRLRVTALTAALVIGLLALAPAAEAGCLSEATACESCAKSKLRRGMLSLSPALILEANADLWDCAIDLNHCVFFGQHHGYKCAR